MKNLTARIIGIILGVTLPCVTIMKLFHAAYIEREFATIWGRFGSFVAIITVISAVAAIVIFITMRPVNATLKRIRENSSVTGEERTRARSAISSLTLIIIGLNIVGYIIGPAIRTFSGLKEGIYTPLKIVITMGYDISLGLVASTFQISWLNIVTMQAKKSLRFYYYDDKQRGLNVRSRQVLFAMSSVLFAACFILAAGWGFVDQANRAAQAGTALPSTLHYTIDMGILLFLLVGVTYIGQRLNAAEIQNELIYLSRSISDTITGKNDLSKRLSILHFDELGMLVHNINKYMDYLQNLIMEIRTTAGKVIHSSETLSRHTGNVKENAELLISANNGVRTNTELQTREIQQADAIINELTKSIEEVFRDIDSQSAIVEESSASISEMSSNIQSVNKIAEKADELATRLKSVSEEGLKSVNDSMEVIRQIEEMSDSVSSFIGIISKIASQTNLLAMNAAIEAAHAGDAGKGFAVVADEVRALAEESSKGAKNITEKIKAMMASIKAGVEKSSQMQDAFNNITNDVEKTSDIIHSVSSAMEEQQIAASEILKSIGALIEATNHIKKASSEQTEKNSLMHKAMQKVISTSYIIEDSVNKQNAANNTIKEIINELYTIASENKETAVSLEDAFLRLSDS
ncbi:MAG: hypothetical protein JW874_00405 [Spirochaetales bacterium]|nr:hypothetical protein [Spirochaetales bacterium]